MKRFRHHRNQGRLTSVCETCGDTSGTTRTDAQAERWQRSHRCTTERKP